MAKKDEYSQVYIVEAQELLSELETSLLELEERPDDFELIGRVFRAMHTIKGSGAMFGFDDIAGFTHEVETVFDQVRNGVIPVTKELIDLTLLSRDQIRLMLEADGGDQVDKEEQQKIIDGLKKLLPEEGGEKGSKEKIFQPKEKYKPAIQIYRIRFKPADHIFMSGTNPIPLLNELKTLGECRVVSHIEKIPDLLTYNSEKCYTCLLYTSPSPRDS